MKKVLLFVCFIMTIAVVFSSCAGTQKPSDSAPSGENVSADAAEPQREKLWKVTYDGKSLTLPCKFTDFEKLGIPSTTPDILDSIFSSPNISETAYFGESGKEFIVEIKTTENPSKETAEVVMYYTTAEGLVFGDGIQVGSTMDETLAAFGEDYYSLNSLSDNINEGIAQVVYQCGDVFLLIYSRDGVVFQIEMHLGGNK